MPELPEVQTTVSGLSRTVVGKTIKAIWSDFHLNTAHGKRKNIKNSKYFDDFKKKVVGAKIKSVARMGKYVIINLSNRNSIVIHMKMTGHLMVGRYKRQNYPAVELSDRDWRELEEFSSKKISVRGRRSNFANWIPVEKKGPLSDPFNKFIHFVASLSNGKHLVLSDMRKFASVCVTETKEIRNHPGIFELGPDPLKMKLGKEFIERIKSGSWQKPIKSTLLDQTVLSGIGNIYSDEILWASGVHPLSQSGKIPAKILNKMFANTKKIMGHSIKMGGDSMSDYRNVFGEKGSFQNRHRAYRRTGQRCSKPKCRGIIKRVMVKGRGAHFCPVHQIKY